MRFLRWAIAASLVLAPAWLLTTSSGLRAVLRVAEIATDEHLRFGASHGALAGDIHLRDLVYSSPGAEVHIKEAAINLRLTRLLLGRVQAESLSVQTLAISTRRAAFEKPDRAPLTVRTPLRLAVEHGELRDLRLQLDGQRAWQLPEARFIARWRDEWINVTQLNAITLEAGTVELRGRLAIVESQLRFEDFAAHSAAQGSLEIAGVLGLGDAASELKLAWKNLRPPLNASDYDLASPQGSLQLQGPWRDYRWQLDAGLRAASTAATLTARGRGDLVQLRWQAAQLQALDGKVQSMGRVNWSDGLRAELDGSWQQLNPGALFKDWPGRLTGSGTFSGTWGAGTPLLEFQTALSDSQLRGYPLSLQATGASVKREVFLRKLELQSGSSALTASGQLLPRFDLNGELRSSDLRSLWASLEGRAQLRARLRGTFEAPDLELAGSGGELALGPLRVARLALNARINPTAASDLRVQLDEVTAPLPLRSAVLTASGAAGKHQAQLAMNGATTSGGLALRGSLAAGNWRGLVTQASFTPGEGAAWRLEDPAALRFVKGRLSVEPLCLIGGNSRACGQLQASAGRQYLALRTREFELKHLRALLPEEWLISGVLSGTASVTLRGGELHDLRADLRGSAGALAGGGVKLSYGPGEFQLQPQGDSLRARLSLTPAGGEVRGELTLGPAASLLDRRITGELVLRLPDLSWLPALHPEIAGAEGALNGGLQVAGTLRSPALEGQIGVSGGRVLLASPGTEFTELSASFESTARAPLVVLVKARAGEGALQLDGELQALTPQLSGKFTLTGDKAQLLNTAEIRAWVSPALQLTLGGGTARLTGDLTVTGALITPRELGSGGIAPSSDQRLVSDAGEPPGGLNVQTELRIVLGDAVRFDGLGLKTRLTGAITAVDDPGRPTRARGELQLAGGRYKAYGQDLQIESGRLIFTGGPLTDPAIDLSAYREPRDDIKVGLRARGTLEAPQITLYSVPAMSQEEQLSWLVLGRSLAATLDRGQGGELAGAAVSLGLTGGDFLAQQLGARLGFDEVSVGAKPGETAEKARFTIGKYLSPRLFVSYGVGLFQPGNFFRLQYDLGQGFKLSGESGVTSGGDVLYTIER